jgi:Fe-S oxidoreductase
VAKAVNGLGTNVSTAELLHVIVYWFHIPLAFVWMAVLSRTKLSHVFTAPANAFLRSTKPVGRLEPIKDFETAETFGVGKVEDFTWKQLFESDVCVRCGRCTNNCPAYIAGQPLSPMAIIQDVRKQMSTVGPQLIDLKRGVITEIQAPELVGERIADESLWACRTCGACVQECPVLIEHVPTIVDMRRYLVMDQARMPDTVQATLQNMEQRGHPWRGTALTRTSWIESLDFEVPEFDGTQEYLYWVGCTGALVDRNVPITQSIVRLLYNAGVSFGVMSAGETCNGDPARRLGNEFLFQMLAEQNIETLKASGVQKVITACPHCFNTFKNEYPDFGMQWEVYHHTEVLDKLLADGKIEAKGGDRQTITFHDSCYLGRQNGIFEAPRNILRQLPMVDLVEMPRNRSKGLCCGAGGGNMFMEEKGERRVNVVRAEEAQSTGADVVATSCPFCIQMFEAGIPSAEPDESRRIRAFDVAELLQASASAEPAPVPAGGDGGAAGHR